MSDPVVDGVDAASGIVAKLNGGRTVLLPNEPNPAASPLQSTLTARYLLPAWGELEAFFLAVRASVDPQLERKQPTKLGKPYPLGQCLEITQAVQQRLRCVDDLPVSDMAALGRTAFCAFLRAGGTLRQVWGDLRGQYFQNAFQLGALYLDVSNDTVTSTKPKVEMLPFADAQFVPIADFVHFTRIAERYWKGDIYPNHALPALAPYFPLIHISPQGTIQLRDGADYMMALVTGGRFQPSEEVLRAPAMPATVFDAVAHALGGAKLKLAVSAGAGRRQALDFCRDYRARRWHQSQAQTAQALQAAQRANLRMAQWHSAAIDASSPPLHAKSPQGAPSTSTITIDRREYDLDTLSDEAKAQLRSLQFVDAEVARMRSQIAVLQTARMAYSKALQAALRSVVKQTT
jgi:hypothetical protein